MKTKRLSSQMSEPLVWTGEEFSYENMVRLYTIADGSCFFHAVVNGFYLPYQTEKDDGEYLDRKEFIQNFRKDLAKRLGEPISKRDPTTPYQLISRGELSKMAEEMKMPEYRLENMQKELEDPNEWIWLLYLEYVSNQINKDIYILDAQKKDVYITGEEDILHAGRDSIVILYLPDHFETVGLNVNGVVGTRFGTNSKFISRIRLRLKELKYLSKNDSNSQK